MLFGKYLKGLLYQSYHFTDLLECINISVNKITVIIVTTHVTTVGRVA
jgi:hypothetical protein